MTMPINRLLGGYGGNLKLSKASWAGDADLRVAAYCPPTDDPMAPVEEVQTVIAHGESLIEAINLLRTVEVRKLKSRVEALERAAISFRGLVVPIHTLSPRALELIKPFNALVQTEDDAFVASFSDANVNGSGETEFEAVEMLKDSIASTFEILCENEQRLGIEPRRQLAVLREFVRSP